MLHLFPDVLKNFCSFFLNLSFKSLGNLQRQFLSPRHQIGITKDNLVCSKWCDFCSTLSWSNTFREKTSEEKKMLPSDIFFFSWYTQNWHLFKDNKKRTKKFIRYLCTISWYCSTTFLFGFPAVQIIDTINLKLFVGIFSKLVFTQFFTRRKMANVAIFNTL